MVRMSRFNPSPYTVQVTTLLEEVEKRQFISHTLLYHNKREALMNSQQLYQWIEQVSNNFPVLGKWQAEGLALFRLGVVLAERCRLSKVAEKLRRRANPDWT